MNYTVENEQLRVVVSDRGAELQSLIWKGSGQEYLWQGEPSVWADRAPILFPVVGRLKDNRYTLNNDSYCLQPHGFAHTHVFTAEQQADSITFTIGDSEYTTAQYPFHFTFAVSFSLVGDRLTKTHTITNLSSTTMPFEVGGHEGYRLALQPEDKIEDYAVQFASQAVTLHTTDDALMLNGQTEHATLSEGKLALSVEMFQKDFLTFSGFAERTARLMRGGQGVLQLDFPKFPYLGIWTMPRKGQTGYICLEPWSALPDGNYLGYELDKKEGILMLDSDTSCTLSYTITIL